MYYYLVDAITGEIFGAYYGGAPEVPEGKVLIDVQTDDNRMAWDFSTSSWHWSKKGLRDLLEPMFQEKIGLLKITIGSQKTWFNSSHSIALYLSAISEDPAASRPLTVDGRTWVTQTNAQIVAMFESVIEEGQMIQTAMQQIRQDIENDVITDLAGVNAAFASYAASYVSNRTKLPSYSDLVATVQSLQAAVAALQQP